MDGWVDGEIMQVRQLQAFNPTFFSRQLCWLCSVCWILLWQCDFLFLSLSLLLKKKTFTEKPEQGTRCTSLNVWDWGIASALRVLWRFRRRGHKRKTLLAFMLCLSSSPLGFEEFHSNAQQNEIVHLKKKSHFRPPPPSCQRPLSRHVTAH